MACASRPKEDAEDVDAGDDAGACVLGARLGPPFWVAFTDHMQGLHKPLSPKK